MKIRKIRLINHKCFEDSGFVELKDGCNLIIGQNNAGKTAFLEAFKFQNLAPVPHKSAALPPTAPLNPSTTIEFDLEVSGASLKHTFLTSGQNLQVPVEGAPPNHKDPREIFEAGAIVFHCRCTDGNTQSRQFPSHDRFPQQHDQFSVVLHATPDRQAVSIAEGVHHAAADGWPNLVAIYTRSIYVFRAERLNIASRQYGDERILAPDASNLPIVMLHLQANHHKFSVFNRHVSDIFPNIARISPVPNGPLIEILVWPTKVPDGRSDLAINLRDSGTGIGQVLAILAVVLTLDEGVIVIDEPNTFLHPGAAKKLINILKSYSQFQYVIATHSADIIAACEPSTLNLVTSDGLNSKIEQMDIAQVDSLRRVLLEVGVSLSDVFGSDAIVWVEGPTEQVCFPKILKAFGSSVPLGVVIRGLLNTGDLETRRHGTAIWEIYERLSNSSALMPQALSFSLDREDRTPAQRDDLAKRSGGRVRFIPRRCYENYLLSPPAIAAILSCEIEGEIPDVESWMVNNAGRFCSGTEFQSITNSNWLENVKAVKLLEALFQELTECRVTYDKLKHSVSLTERILENSPEEMAELAEYVKKLVLPNGSPD
jgi:hypothetical protein